LLHSSNPARPSTEAVSDCAPDLGPELYRELRSLALGQMAREPSSHTLQATALVHEAWIRLRARAQRPAGLQERGAFLRQAGATMRRILVDYARKRRSQKRGGAHERLSLEVIDALEGERPLDLLELDVALEELAILDPRAFQIVELRFFGGLELREIAELLDLSERTIKREWATARLWLYDRVQRRD